MTGTSWLLAEVSVRTKAAESGAVSFAVYASTLPGRGRPPRGPFLFVEREADSLVTLEAGSLSELLRLVVARRERLVANVNPYLVRALFFDAGLEIDEAQLATFEAALDGIADEGARRARGRPSS